MPKGGCSRTPQHEDFSLSNDMVEKQTGKKVTPELPSSLLAPQCWTLACSGCPSVPVPSAAVVRQRPSALAKEDLDLKDVLTTRGPKLSFKFDVSVHVTATCVS